MSQKHDDEKCRIGEYHGHLNGCDKYARFGGVMYG
jgi:hypothetical protein